MKKYNFIFLLLFIICFASCNTNTNNNTSTKKTVQKKPNIVFVLADDLGYGDVGYEGQKLMKTPNIDKLASEGKVFTDTYAGAPICGPSRCVLMTGENTGHATIRGNTTITGGVAGKKGSKTVYRANIKDSDYTVGNLMKEAGYKTCLIGKWHLGGFVPTASPLYHGFDEFHGWLINKPETYASTYWPDKRMDNDKMVDIPQNANGKKGYYHTDMCTDEAIDYIKENKNSDKPFLLMLCYSNPHAPLDAPDNAIYEDKDWPKDAKTYASMTYHLDENIERLKQTIINSGISDNTIVFLCSDNGPRSNYSDRLTKVVDFFDSNGPLRGYKRDVYEGGIRTPMIVWSPKLVKGGTTSSYPWYFADVMPTFADIAGYKPDSMKTDGISVYPAIEDKAMPDTPRFMYWEFFERGYKQAVRYGKWKADVIKGKMELYDLSVDVGEQNDIADQNPEIVKEIQDYLSKCRTDSPFWPVK